MLTYDLGCSVGATDRETVDALVQQLRSLNFIHLSVSMATMDSNRFTWTKEMIGIQDRGLRFAVLLFLVTAFGCQRSNEEELAKLKAEVEATKAELAKAKTLTESESPAKASVERPVEPVVKGELFITTKGGDVKRAAGLSVRLVAVTEDFANRLNDIIDRYEKTESETNAAMKEWEKEHPKPRLGLAKWTEEFDSAHVALAARRQQCFADGKNLLSASIQETTTDSDGRFQLQAASGTYLLISATYSLPQDKVAWCKIFRLSDQDRNSLFLSLNQDSAVAGHHVYDFVGEPPEKDILGAIAAQLK